MFCLSRAPLSFLDVRTHIAPLLFSLSTWYESLSLSLPLIPHLPTEIHRASTFPRPHVHFPALFAHTERSPLLGDSNNHQRDNGIEHPSKTFQPLHSSRHLIIGGGWVNLLLLSVPFALACE